MKTKQERKEEAWREYQKKSCEAWEEYDKIYNPAYEAYEKKLEEINNEEESEK